MKRIRRMNTWFVSLLVIGTLLTGLDAGIRQTPAARAEQARQLGGSPLVFLKDGDLWSWNGGALTQLTTWSYNERPVLSPDGSRIAYNSWAEITVDAIAAGKPVLGVIPSNIWVMDPRTGASSAYRVSEQPMDARFWEDGVSDIVTMSSTPTWAPDGNALAWVELRLPEFSYHLVIHDFTHQINTAPIVGGLPTPFSDAGFVGLPEPKWGSAGIALTIAAVNASTQELEDTLYVYDINGALVTSAVVGTSSSEWLYAFEWMTTPDPVDQNPIGLLYPSGKQYALDPITGEQTAMTDTPNLVSTTADISVRAFPSLGVNSAGESGQIPWSVTSADGSQGTVIDFDGSPAALAISADGSAVAYITDAVYIWQNNQLAAVPGTEGIAAPGQSGLVWGPTVWQVETLPAATAVLGLGAGGSAGGGCVISPRLTVGGSGQITPGLPNALRTQPQRGTGSVTLGLIPAGGVFNVISGPVCDNERTLWWQVTYNGMTGWTPEGRGYVYWAQPVSTTPPTVYCTLPPRLTTGTTAYVTPGLPNLIRALPQRGTASTILGRIPGGGFFTVLSGPQCDTEGRYWYQVSYNGLVGYTAEGENGVYWLAPFGCPASPAPRLAPGMLAVVTPGAPNRLRSGPGTNYATVSDIPGGGLFTVLSGPQCGPEGWSYWRVQYGNQVGWTAEGDGSIYWLEPYQWEIPPIGTPIPNPVMCSPAPRLQVGAAGRVLPGLPNALRSEPGQGNGVVLLNIPGGTVFDVLGGPVCAADGRYWWQVNFQGTVGWTPEGEGSTYWIELYGDGGPITCSLTPRLRAGITAQVLPGLPNAIRNQPFQGESSTVIGQIPGGDVFYVVGGPVCDAQNRWWWNINYLGITGWTAEGEGNTYWVQPLQ